MTNVVQKKKHRKKVTDGQILEAIKGGGGTDLASAAWIKKHYGITVDRTTVNKRVLANPDLQAAKREADDETVDAAEVKLRELIYQGDKSAIFFLLKYKGKKRGYISQYATEIANKDGEVLKVSTEDPELKNMPIREVMALAREHFTGKNGG